MCSDVAAPSGANGSSESELGPVLELLSRLVAFDTESEKTNLDLIAFLEAHLAMLGVETTRLPNADGTKAALFATVGPKLDGGVCLSGHTDVVPVAGQAWSHDPFTLRVADRRAYGRGAVDMKGFLALMLAAVPTFQAAGLKRPVHLLFSYDEETTCLGVMDAIRAMGATLPRPSAVIVGEPTGMEVADAHKSVATFFTDVHGFEVHSANPATGANAIFGATLLIGELMRLRDEMIARGDPSGRFDPPYTTVHVGTIQGGNARNIVPRLCTFNWEFRGVPGLDPDEIPARLAAFGEARVLPELRRGFAGARVETRREVLVPGLKPDAGSPAETLALRLAGRNRTITVPFGTEGGNFQEGGLPTVVCGPGSIAQAHQPDEFVELAALAEGLRFMKGLARELSI